MTLAANQKILDRELQEGEEVLYLWEGNPRRHFFPHVNEYWRRIGFGLYMVGYGIALGWIFFEAEADIRRSSFGIIIGILSLQLIGKFFSFGPLRKLDIQLSNFDLSVITDRRILVFDRDERIANMPLNDFKCVSFDIDNGAKVIRLSKRDKTEDVIFANNQTPSLLETLEPIIRDGATA